MSRAIFSSVLVAACICLRPLAASQTPAQTPAPAVAPAVDRALLAQFVAATDAERAGLVQAHPEILTAAFRTAMQQQGATQRTNGELPAAERTYAALLYIGRRHAQPVVEITALLGLGAVEGTRSDFPKAKTYLDQALGASVASNYLPGWQQALNNLGTVQRRTGDLDGAMDSQERSLALARQVGDPLAIARVLNNLGITYNDTGQGARAIAAYAESLALKQKNGAPVTEIVNTLSNTGGVYAEQGDYPLAIEYYGRAKALVESNSLDELATSVYNNLGQVYATINDVALARQYLTRGLALAEKIEDPTRMATSLFILASIDRAEGRLDTAEAAQRRALTLRESAGDRLGLVESLTEMASLLEARHRLEEAVPYGERAVALATESRLLNQLWKAQLAVGHIHAALGHDREAGVYYERAIETIENLRQLAAGGQRAQQGYLADRMGPYYGLAALDARAGKTFDALAHIDHARARALVDILTTGKLPADRLTPAQRDEDRRLTTAVLLASKAVDEEAGKPEHDPKRVAELDAAVSRARIAREAFRAELYAAQPDLRFARGNTPEITRDRLASVLTAGTAIVTFVLDDDVAWIYVATRGSNGPVVTTERIALGTKALVALAERFARQISTRDLAFSSNARALYGALFGKVDAALAGVTHVILIPDGPLWQVPFQALQTPRGRFLIEERSVSYTPSITALAALEQRRSSRAAQAPFLVALGDPAVAAATAEQPGAQRGVHLARLPEAAREVRSLGRLYGASRSSVLVDTDATEAALRQLVSRASVLHVATHGVLENNYPMYSHLMLAPDRKSDAGDHTTDGRIEAWELLDMDITADIAVLSACQTARGGTGFGEGVIGLSWSLFASGASTAVVSQWEVDSANTTNLMIAFHQRLLKSGSRTGGAPAALREAAMTLLKRSASRHPFYWAGFISVGAK